MVPCRCDTYDKLKQAPGAGGGDAWADYEGAHTLQDPALKEVLSCPPCDSLVTFVREEGGGVVEDEMGGRQMDNAGGGMSGAAAGSSSSSSIFPLIFQQEEGGDGGGGGSLWERELGEEEMEALIFGEAGEQEELTVVPSRGKRLRRVMLDEEEDEEEEWTG